MSIAPSTIGSVNTKVYMSLEIQSIIHFPKHVKSEHVVAWLDKTLGGTGAAIHPFNADSASWLNIYENYAPENIFNLLFSDFLGQKYSWKMCICYDGTLALFPTLNDLTRSLAPKLAQFFGGSVRWMGPLVSGAPDIRVDDHEAIFENITNGQALDSNHFERALAAQPQLTVFDLVTSELNNSEEYRLLLGALDSLDRRAKLTDVVQTVGRLTTSCLVDSPTSPGPPLAF